MNITQNRTRIIEVLVGLLATQLIVFGLAFTCSTSLGVSWKHKEKFSLSNSMTP